MVTILSGLSEGQVLQRLPPRGATVTLRLCSDDPREIFCTISGPHGPLKSWKARRLGRANPNGRRFSLTSIPPGGPYRLQLVCGKSTTTLEPFYVGDVWLLAGQSNMEGCADMSGAARSHPLIRSFSMAREWRLARDPLHIPMESPDSCHSQGKPLTRAQAENHRRTTTKGVGVGIFFAQEMRALTDLPQGLICTAHGGTTMTQWDPSIKTSEGLYGSMLASVRATGQPVAGILWYQGESDANADDHKMYTLRMKKWVASARRDLKQPTLPWIICQSARAFGRNKPSEHWNSIQDQQRQLPDVIRNLDLVTTIDLPMDDPLHIGAAGFPRLAHRLADVARRLVHRAPRTCPTPRLRRIRAISAGPSQQIEVLYEHVLGGLQSRDAPHGFTLLDAESHALPIIFKTTLVRNTVVLHLAHTPPEGATLAYGHGHTPVCNITDGRGHAIPVFAPQPIERDAAWLPFMNSWQASDVLTSPGLSLSSLLVEDLIPLPTTRKTYEAGGFVNEHSRWEKQTGLGFFASTLDLPEPMTLEAFMGYDGPFRLWIDEQPFFTDLAGTNPCVPDQSRKKTTLSQGRHTLRVAMDLNGGLAWGFFLRFKRCDVTRSQIHSGTYAKPVYAT